MQRELISFYTKHKIIINCIIFLIMAFIIGSIQDEQTR